jgi:phospholipid/cholesterol/gamma-HCH transport system substrate-binding protein
MKTVTASPKETTSKADAPVSVNRHVQKPNYEVRVGMFTLFAFMLFLYGQAWLKQFSIMHPPQRITVRFNDVAGLANNAPVNINGVRVGTVEKIELEGKGLVLARLKIKTEEATVPQGSTFTIQTLGMVGAKYIEISLPEEIAGEEPRPPIDPDVVVVGEDPVRVELVINKIATNLNRVIGRLGDEATQKGLADALQHSGATIKTINEAATKLNKNMDKFSEVTTSVKTTSDRFGTVALKANGFFERGQGTFSDYSALSRDLRKTSGKVNTMLDDPNMRGDIKETINSAKQTAETIRETMKELNGTLKDKDLRTDITNILNRINNSTKDISVSMEKFGAITNNGELRDDIKQIVSNAKDAVTKVENLVSEPEFKSDLRKTIKKVESAAGNVDIAAQQMHQVLGQKHLLFKAMFGTLGKVKVEKKSKTETKKDGTETTTETTKTETKSEEAPTSEQKTPPTSEEVKLR